MVKAAVSIASNGISDDPAENKLEINTIDKDELLSAFSSPAAFFAALQANPYAVITLGVILGWCACK